MKRLTSILLAVVMCVLPVLAEAPETVLPDGVYSAVFNTDSGMFRLNETCEGRGILYVKDGVMTIHITLLSKNYLFAFAGTAEEAKAEGALHIAPTVDTVVYSDGFEDTVYGFDIPVPALDQEFTIALVGKKGKWYSHKVSVTEPHPFIDGEQ